MRNIYSYITEKCTFNLESTTTCGVHLVIKTQASWYSRFILASLFSLTHNIQPLTIPTNSSFWPILKFPFASIISESMMIYRLLFLAALLGIANAVESCYFCVSPIMKSADILSLDQYLDYSMIGWKVNCSTKWWEGMMSFQSAVMGLSSRFLTGRSPLENAVS